MNKKRILIVDDEENFTKILKINLEETGRYTVRTENKGSLALDAARQFKPDLILLDIFMPDMEGTEVAFGIKNDKETRDVPIVFVTGTTKTEEVEAGAGNIGGWDFVAKPVSVEKIIDVIEEKTE